LIAVKNRSHNLNESFFSRSNWALFNPEAGLNPEPLYEINQMWNGFDFYFFNLDRIYRIIGIFFACGEGPFGRRPHHPNDPVNPGLIFFFKIRIHSSFSLKI
jgi:hypothetical protein